MVSGRVVAGQVSAALHGIVEVVEETGFFAVLYFQVGNGRLQTR
ncbi:MAG: hypothetical protein M5U34_04680 [Chloroflexi bacterium]|nr:hypothetical protein [Chloroflexota bacterium]